jgi:hypothetical protein
VHRSLGFRALAALLALLACVPAPALAIAHGMVHAHLSAAHQPPALDASQPESRSDDHDHDHPAPGVPDAPAIGAQAHGPEVERSSHGHHHGHDSVAQIILAPDVARELLTGPLAPAPAAAAPLTLAETDARAGSRWRSRETMARPAPHLGAQRQPRAPPARTEHRAH